MSVNNGASRKSLCIPAFRRPQSIHRVRSAESRLGRIVVACQPGRRTVDTASEIVLPSQRSRAVASGRGARSSVRRAITTSLGVKAATKKDEVPTLLGGKMLRINVTASPTVVPTRSHPTTRILARRFARRRLPSDFATRGGSARSRDRRHLAWRRRRPNLRKKRSIASSGEATTVGRGGTACRKPGACADESVHRPVVQHSHNEMCSVTGGYVYRGRALPSLRGRYVYADFLQRYHLGAPCGRVWHDGERADREQHSGDRRFRRGP